MTTLMQSVKWRNHLERERSKAVKEAKLAVEKARSELDHIEQQLDLADRMKPYFRIGTIYGVSAPDVFGAFAAIESLATWDKMHQPPEEEQRNNPLPLCGGCGKPIPMNHVRQFLPDGEQRHFQCAEVDRDDLTEEQVTELRIREEEVDALERAEAEQIEHEEPRTKVLPELSDGPPEDDREFSQEEIDAMVEREEAKADDPDLYR